MIAYLDCFSSISGDMLLGARVHARLPLYHLPADLARLLWPYPAGLGRWAQDGGPSTPGKEGLVDVRNLRW